MELACSCQRIDRFRHFDKDVASEFERWRWTRHTVRLCSYGKQSLYETPHYFNCHLEELSSNLGQDKSERHRKCPNPDEEGSCYGCSI